MRRMSLVGAYSIALFLCTTAFAVGCGDDDSGKGGSGGTPTTSNSGGGGAGGAGEGGAGEGGAGEGGAQTASNAISVTIEYAGMEMGPVFAALVEDPMTPVPVKFASEMMPAFPVTLEIKDIPDGSYYVVAVMDLDGNPTMRSANEPAGSTAMAITFPTDQAEVTVTLTDPPAP